MRWRFELWRRRREEQAGMIGSSGRPADETRYFSAPDDPEATQARAAVVSRCWCPPGDTFRITRALACQWCGREGTGLTVVDLQRLKWAVENEVATCPFCAVAGRNRS